MLAINYPMIFTVAVVRMDVKIRFEPREYHQMQIQCYFTIHEHILHHLSLHDKVAVLLTEAAKTSNSSE